MRPPTIEHQRLEEDRLKNVAWKKWGPYLSERQWGTVREDYSESGDAWNYFTHDMARSRAYRWGEDGMAGICDDKQLLCFALAFWNGNDATLKERLFGLTNSEGNHGEDCKEYYFYLDSTPTHSYMKYLYKYPQAPFPYADLVKTNGGRSRNEPEYELIDTGIFEQDRYFDIFVEYCKEAADDILVRVTAVNRGDVPATLHLLPHLWFRNTWSDLDGNRSSSPPRLQAIDAAKSSSVAATHPKLGNIYWHFDRQSTLLFTENETNAQKLWGNPNLSPFVKDAFHRFVIEGRQECVNPALEGTKVAAHHKIEIEPHGRFVLKMRLNPSRTCDGAFFGAPFDASFEKRLH